MNVAFFVDTYVPQVNGVVTVVKKLKEDLEHLGCKCYVLTPCRGNSPQLDGVYFLKARQSVIAPSEYVAIEDYANIVRFCKEHKIDILHAHSEFRTAKLAIKTAKELNIPFVITFHTFWKYYVKAYIPCGFLVPLVIVDMYTKYIYKHADVIYAVSDKVKEYMTSLLPNNRVELIENAVDKSDFTQTKNSDVIISALKKNYSVQSSDFVLLYVGRVSHEKRLRELLKMLASILKRTQKSVKLFVVGDGPATNDLKTYSKKLCINDNVIFTGFIDRKELSKFFSIADVFVSASLSETYSMTVTESLTSGVPVVLREDACYFDRVTHGKNGILAKNDADFTNSILELLSQPEKLYLLKSNCRQATSEITSLEQAKKYLASYHEILKNKKYNEA